jgi:hypothetical protein
MLLLIRDQKESTYYYLTNVSEEPAAFIFGVEQNGVRKFHQNVGTFLPH